MRTVKSSGSITTVWALLNPQIPSRLGSAQIVARLERLTRTIKSVEEQTSFDDLYLIYSFMIFFIICTQYKVTRCVQNDPVVFVMLDE